MTVLVFGTYLASGRELDAGKVFTATSFFGMLNAPMRDFPQTMVSSLQAFVSLDRLSKFLSDSEIDSTAVDRVESITAGTVAVKVQDGVFAWDVLAGEAKGSHGQADHGSEHNGREEEAGTATVVKGIHVQVRKGSS